MSTGKKFFCGGGNRRIVHIKNADYIILPYGSISAEKQIQKPAPPLFFAYLSAPHIKDLSFGKSGKKPLVAAGEKNLAVADAV